MKSIYAIIFILNHTNLAVYYMIVFFFQEVVDALANMLGMRKVGWILAHPPREKG